MQDGFRLSFDSWIRLSFDSWAGEGRLTSLPIMWAWLHLTSWLCSWPDIEPGDEQCSCLHKFFCVLGYSWAESCITWPNLQPTCSEHTSFEHSLSRGAFNTCLKVNAFLSEFTKTLLRKIWFCTAISEEQRSELILFLARILRTPLGQRNQVLNHWPAIFIKLSIEYCRLSTESCTWSSLSTLLSRKPKRL